MTTYDTRYKNILNNISIDSQISFPEKVLLSTSKNKLVLAFFDGYQCSDLDIHHLGTHLLLAESMEHRNDIDRFHEIKKVYDFQLKSAMNKFKINLSNERYHYDVYNKLRKQLAGDGPVSCSTRLFAAGLMYSKV